MSGLEFHVLGPLEVLADGEPLPLGGRRARQRAVLAYLLLHRGESVTTDRLIDVLWGEHPPASAKTALHGHIAELRRVLEPGRSRRAAGDVLVTDASGYTLRVEADAVDSARFETLAARGWDALEAGRPAAAADLLHAALALWRGQALGDLAYEPWAAGEAERLEELRLACVEGRIEAKLALGRHDDVIGELEALVDANPLRERPRRLLMLALYRQGRHAEALERYQEARTILGEELGLDPSSDLRELHRRILNQDPSLAVAPPAAPASVRLPTPATSFLGRARERAEIGRLFGREDVRLLTLTGPGGTGKTRLAVETAREAAPAYRDGVVWIDLQALTDPALVVPAIASALGAAGDLAEHLAGAELLLVLDNFEQVVEGAADVASLLAAAPLVNALVTSRERLRVAGETEYQVPPLSDEEAVALFVARAESVQGDVEPLATVEAVCRRLDCLPLAIELAAARTRSLSPARIHSRLEQRLSLLTDGPRDRPARQQTLRATIEWSYDLLVPSEQALFRRLAVFSGGCPLEVAESVCGGEIDTVLALAEKSLVRVRGDRVWMLETIRAYASERLAETAEPDLHERHARWCLEATSDALSSEASLELAWLELHNLRAAFDWAHVSGPAELALELAVRLAEILTTRSMLVEARDVLMRALERDADVPAALRAEVLHEAAGVALRQGDADALATLSRSALEHARESGDTLGAVRALTKLTNVALAAGDVRQAAICAEEALEVARAADDTRGLANGLNALGMVHLAQERFAEARDAFERALELVSGQPHRRETIATLVYNVGVAALLAGDRDVAENRLGESLSIYRALGDVEGVAYCFVAQAALGAAADDAASAVALLDAAERLLADAGSALEPVEETIAARTWDALSATFASDELARLRAAGADLAEAELARIRAA